MIFKIKLHWQILIAFVAAIAYGYFLPDQVQYILWMGVIFLRALNMVVVPLVFSSIVSGMASNGSGSNLSIQYSGETKISGIFSFSFHFDNRIAVKKGFPHVF
jgi:Na+/H+-dicarboxylate symporter